MRSFNSLSRLNSWDEKEYKNLTEILKKKNLTYHKASRHEVDWPLRENEHTSQNDLGSKTTNPMCTSAISTSRSTCPVCSGSGEYVNLWEHLHLKGMSSLPAKFKNVKKIIAGNNSLSKCLSKQNCQKSSNVQQDKVKAQFKHTIFIFL